jgi:ribonuclease Z
MKTFEVTILGSLAALPHKGKITSSQIILYSRQSIMVDCGEGTQMMISKYRINTSRIKLLCISHLHGDHLFGLPGMLSSFQHHQRTEPLTIIGPPGIAAFIQVVLNLTQQYITYPITIKEIEAKERTEVFHFDDLTVSAFPLNHRIVTYGYFFEEKSNIKKIKKEVVQQYQLSVDEIRQVLKGDDVIRKNGEVLPNDIFTLPDSPKRSYAYCSDTMYDEKITDWIKGVTTLYHEATYLHDMVEKAVERKHTTSKQAGLIAKKAEAGKLIIGHFSSRYTDISELVAEAKEEFECVYAALEGSVFSV